VVAPDTYSQMFLDVNGNGVADSGEPILQLPRGVQWAGGGAPAIPAGSLGFTPQGPSVPGSFSGMGLPCVLRNGVCSSWDSSGNAVGFVYFLEETNTPGSRWAAVSVSPAGRLRAWMWQSGSGQWGLLQ
jgi:hypothetical protein